MADFFSSNPASVLCLAGSLFLVWAKLYVVKRAAKPLQDPRLLEIVERSFRKAGVPAPTIQIVAPEKLNHLPSVSLHEGSGRLRPPTTLLLNRNLLEIISIEEFEDSRANSA